MRCKTRLRVPTLALVLSLALQLLCTTSLRAQYQGLAAPGDGSTVFFSEDRPLKGTLGQPQGRIYSIDNGALTLVAELPTPVLPDYIDAPHPYFTDYYSLERLDKSRDGLVTAITGRRDCWYASSCGDASTYSTAISFPGRESFSVQGKGFLSGNGRYLVTFDFYALQPLVVTDLRTGQQWASTVKQHVSLPTTGRIISDSGTFVIRLASLIIIQTRDQSVTYSMGFSGDDAVIDASGEKVVYSTSYDRTPGIHIYRLATREDSVLFSSRNAGGAAISADGKLTTFLVYTNPESLPAVNGLPQLYAMGTDGTALRKISADPAGVKDYVLSDDGRTAWYVSGTGRMVKVDVDSSVSTEALGPPPSATLPDSRTGRLVSGSAFSIRVNGVSTRNASALVGGVNAPIIATGSDFLIAQIPWEVRNQWADYEFATESSSPFDATFRGTAYVGEWEPRLALAINQDWSGLVTRDHPAHPGEIVNFYGTGFGPVNPPVATGQSTPANPLSKTATEFSCNATILFSGLAPGLVGYYQVTVQLPRDIQGPTFLLSCSWPPASLSPSYITYSIPIAR